MAFLAHISMKSETKALKVSILQKADPVKEKVHFCYYRLAKGVSGILSYAKKGIRLWFRTKRPAYRQLCLKLVVWIDKRILLPKARFRWGLFRCLNSSASCLTLKKKWRWDTFRSCFSLYLLQSTETQVYSIMTVDIKSGIISRTTIYVQIPPKHFGIGLTCNKQPVNIL